MRELAKKGLLTGFLVMMLGAGGCTYARIYATSGNTVAMTALRQTRANSFSIKERVMFDYTGALDVQELVRRQYGSGRTIQNVTVKVQQDPMDFLVNFATLGIAQSKTFEVSGDLIQN